MEKRKVDVITFTIDEFCGNPKGTFKEHIKKQHEAMEAEEADRKAWIRMAQSSGLN